MTRPRMPRLPVSVVIPTRDWLPLLQRAVASALAQGGLEFEVIVVDDGSVDGTQRWLAEVEGPTLHVLRNPAPRGVSTARNAGVAAAAGEWIAFLDDDDFWGPGYLAAQLEQGRVARAGLVAASAVFVEEDGRPTHLRWAPVDKRDIVSALLAENVFGGPSRVIVRRDAVLAAGGFDPRLDVMADWDLWLSVAGSERVALTLNVLVAVTNHPDNMQVRQVDAIAAEIRYIRVKHAGLAASTRAPVGGAELSRWLAGQYRRAGRRWKAGGTSLALGLRYRSPRDALRGVAIVIAGGRLVGRRTSELEWVPEWLSAATARRVQA